MEIDDLAKRVKELSEAKQAEEAAELKRLQALREARPRIQEAMQGQPPTDNSQPGESPTVGGAGHVETRPEQKETELDLRRIEAREGPPSQLLGPEGVRRMQGRRIEG